MRRASLIALGAVITTGGGCLQILGYEEPTLYQKDAGSGGATTSTSVGGGGGGACTPGETQTCYSGPPETAGVGTCHAGTASCGPSGSWAACEGEVTPAAQSCAGSEDVACLGRDNCARWAMRLGALSGVAIDNRPGFVTIAAGADGSSILAGSFTGTIPLGDVTLTSALSAAFAIKLDAAGQPMWGKAFAPSNGETAFTAVAVDHAGDVILGGWASAPTGFGAAAVGPGAFMVKLSVSGDHLWSRTIASPCQCYPNCVTAASPVIHALTTDGQGDIALGGSFCLTLDVGDGPVQKPVPANVAANAGFVAKLRGSDGSGKAADGGWSKVFGTGLKARATGVAVDAQGAVVAVGDFDADVSFGGSTLSSAGGSDVFLAKLAFPFWQVQIGGPEDQFAAGIAADPLGGLVLTGFSSGATDVGGGPGVTGPFAVRYTSALSFDWSVALEGATPFWNRPISVAVATSGDIVLAGMFTSALDIGGSPLGESGGGDAFVAKLSASGELLWKKGYGGAAEDKVTAVAITPAGDPVLAGDTLGTIDFGLGPLASTMGRSMFVAKLSP